MALLSSRRPGSRPLGLISVLLTLVVLAAALGASPPSAPATVAPGLAAHTARALGQPVALIVRGAGSLEGLADAIQRVGGEVTAELRLIGALAARIPAGQVDALAASPAVRSISLDAPIASTATNPWELIDTSKFVNAYPAAIGADKLWNRSVNPLRGEGVTVAVIDSGMHPQEDLYTMMGRGRLIQAVASLSGYDTTPYDGYGHGNHVAGIIGGNGRRSGGLYIGVAPEADLINVRVLDANGAGTISGMIQGLQWVYDNYKTYNIRVVNISINSTEPESYHTSPLSAAVEALWFNGIVVVVSAGNQGENALYPPANDPFVITVGASDDRGTKDVADDRMTSWSAFGRTVDNIAKPDLVAPGTNLISLLPNSLSTLATQHPDHVFNSSYFSMSGTSMAAPVVAGAAALLLQSEPGLTPDQVKYRLMATARPFSTRARAGAGLVDIYAAVTNPVAGAANQGVAVSTLLAGSDTGLLWNAVTSGTVSWRGKGTAFFGSVSWRGKAIGTSASAYWGP